MCPIVYNDNSTFRTFSITMASLLTKKKNDCIISLSQGMTLRMIDSLYMQVLYLSFMYLRLYS